MSKFNRTIWVLTAPGIYFLNQNNILSPEANVYSFVLALIFALPLPIKLSLLQKGQLRFR